MTTVREFVNQNSVWHSLMPTLEQFTRYINRHLLRLGRPVPAQNTDRRSSFVAEVAFEIAAAGGDLEPQKAAIMARARAALAHLPGAETSAEAISVPEWFEAMALARNLSEFVGRRSGVAAYRPMIPGCGVVRPSSADVLVGNEIFEVKMVQRGFRSSDIRQAVTYCAMLHASGAAVGAVSLVNPRQGHYFSSTVAGFALDAGSASWVELMQDLCLAMEGIRFSE